MPNGGMLPCCKVCKWLKTLDNTNQVQCTRHQLEILNPHYTFCANLAGHEGTESFIVNNPIKPDMVYQWLETAYKDPKYPSIPQYHHEYVELVSIKEYPGYSSRIGPILRDGLEKLRIEREKHQKKWWQFWK